MELSCNNNNLVTLESDYDISKQLEETNSKFREDIWILGGWHGIAALVILTRGILNVSTIRSFDIDPSCENIADTLLNNWVWQSWKFKAFTRDCNTLDYKSREFPTPSLIINTSCEHFDKMDWFDNIPNGEVIIPHICNNVGGWGAGFVVPLGRHYPDAKKSYKNLKNYDYVRYGFQPFKGQLNLPLDGDISLKNKAYHSGTFGVLKKVFMDFNGFEPWIIGGRTN